MKKTFTGKTRMFICLSGAIIAVALILQIAGLGLNLGVDFTGGSLLKYSVGEDYDVNDVEIILNSAGYQGNQITKAAPSEVNQAVQSAEETEDAAQQDMLLDPDKSGIVKDGLTDLQIRLTLLDEDEGLEDALTAAVQKVLPDAQKRSYGALGNSAIMDNDLSSDYAGGSVIAFDVEGEHDAEALIQTVKDELAAADFSVMDVAELAADGEEGSLRLAVKLDDEATRVRTLIENEMRAKYPDFRFVSVDHVSAIAGRDLLGNAVKALLIAFVCMLIYIAIRFDPFSGLAALTALVHDVLIMCSFMVFFRALFQVNSSFIAAVLTIIGYSINNTIIIFDRIRENVKRPGWSDKTRTEIVELSVGATLSRTVNTALTTLVMLVVLYIFGVEAIREFAFPLIIGMLAGTYSSVMLSGQIWAKWVDRRDARRGVKKV